MHEYMKTITLSENAYNRLLAWKMSSKDSFSSVVERVVPKRGTMGEALQKIKKLPELTDGELDKVENAARSNRSWKDQRDPWIS